MTRVPSLAKTSVMHAGPVTVGIASMTNTAITAASNASTTGGIHILATHAVGGVNRPTKVARKWLKTKVRMIVMARETMITING